MKLLKPYFHAANTNKAQRALSKISKKYKKYSLIESNVIIVLGGDGTILSLINNEKYRKKKIYGMNRGT